MLILLDGHRSARKATSKVCRGQARQLEKSSHPKPQSPESEYPETPVPKH